METIEHKSERIAARVTPEQKTLIARAAKLRGRTLTEFMVESAQKEAEIAVNESLVIRLTIAQQTRLVESLANPPEPNKALKAAAKRYDEANIISR